MSGEFTKVDNTHDYPYQSICKFSVTRKRARLFSVGFNSTGFLIHQNFLLTAAHNFATYSFLGVTSSVSKWDTRFGATGSEEVLRLPEYKSREAFDLPKQYRKYSYPFDYCLIKLQSPITILNPFKLHDYEDQGLTVGQEVFVAGYPRSNDMLHAKGKIVNIDGSIVDYAIDTKKGLSGAPVWVKNEDGTASVIGVHVKGLGRQGSARLIDRSLRNQLKEWGYPE